VTHDWVICLLVFGASLVPLIVDHVRMRRVREEAERRMREKEQC
jgi:hypothetical protein